MALVLDTSAVYALLDRRDQDHSACLRMLESLREPLVIPAPVLPEVDYLIETRLHGGLRIALLNDVIDGYYQIEDLRGPDYLRVLEISDRYADSPIGFVDAAVLAIVERLDERKLATLDRRHFGMMRPRHVQSLRLLPD